MMLLMFLGGLLYFWRQKAIIGIYFTFVILGIAYVFSSWWIWTYGGGIGQRPMIDFYPIIALGFAGFLQRFVVRKFYVLVFLPFIGLNIIQSFQIHKSILVGGQTTWDAYVQQFLKIKRPIPPVAIESHWEKVASYKTHAMHKLDDHYHFSEPLEIPHLLDSCILVVQVRIKGTNESEKISLVVSDSTSDYYQNEYIGNVMYRQERTLSYKFMPPKNVTSKIRVYLWNGDSDEVAQVSFIKVDVYKTKE